MTIRSSPGHARGEVAARPRDEPVARQLGVQRADLAPQRGDGVSHGPAPPVPMRAQRVHDVVAAAAEVVVQRARSARTARRRRRRAPRPGRRRRAATLPIAAAAAWMSGVGAGGDRGVHRRAERRPLLGVDQVQRHGG